MKEVHFTINVSDGVEVTSWLVEQQFKCGQVKWKKLGNDPVKFTIQAPESVLKELYSTFLEKHNFLM